MYISPNDVEAALLRIYAELQIPPGAALSHSYLLKRWRENRLRHSDLDATLNRLIRSRQMDARDSFEGRAFALTPSGQRRARTLRTGPGGRLLRRLRLAWAQVMRRRGSRDGDAAQHRRLIDRAATRI
ncbi:MAG TPA: hypothetical protein VHE37_16500 [Nevskiaceae bacterium]|nr:hypothetical protein [Nevskiaceae bacterium]